MICYVSGEPVTPLFMEELNAHARRSKIKVQTWLRNLRIFRQIDISLSLRQCVSQCMNVRLSAHTLTTEKYAKIFVQSSQK